MSSKRVFISGALSAIAIEKFKQNFDLTYKPDCPKEEIAHYIRDCHIWISRSETTISREFIDQAPALEVIARAAVGVGNIDIEYATKRGILVINCPGKNTNSAAELSLGLMLAMLRHIPEASGHLKNGGWDRHRYQGHELNGKVLGIVGLGHVGHRVAQFARGFDMQVLAYDPYIAPEVFKRYKVEAVRDISDLASRCDILSLHVPLNKETRGMVDKKVLAAMQRPLRYLVNAARGGVADEKAVLEALNEGILHGAAIDTFENEPKPLAELITHPKVWCTQHLGASTFEAQERIGQSIFDQVLKASQGRIVDHPVNLPEIAQIDHPLLASYASLGQKLGSLLAQVLDFNPDTFEIFYRGEIAELDTSVIKLSIIKGYLAHVVDDYVSFVNAFEHLNKVGIKITESKEKHFSAFKSALKIKAKGKKTMNVGGVVYDQNTPRISMIGDFHLEIDPDGHMVLIENNDQPGVIGAIGLFFGDRNINIDSFTLSRNRPGGHAMALVKIDKSLDTKAIQEMKGLPNILNVKNIIL
jgi:D-3-phosphoglycerate dehydrogenase / 2-oxoglutarate reductase